ncbi:MAG: tRNA uridine-5-carboxymethylaminomethyl(34) synthesis GTPase MnmE [Gallionella sp.]|nr:tRNA uridine-5-carboxymethylaminomethyl(34) synthesis GTPase MnmE [Gallionella sp.]MDP1939101.1 tRNA uridine-5-carboxymethylaminomethyl(34) synthesis GTPase MnmE [Gallionella sp.]
MQPNADTIAAIATAQGRGGVGVVRISGKGIAAIALSVLGRLPAPRHATLSDFLDGNNQVIDQGIALYFPAPHSYTGEEVLELQGHGGSAVLHLLLQRCLSLGVRLAEPGEFTQRAFLNDKLDLAQAESVADLIDATTSEAARSAVRSLQGEFSAAINVLVDQLVRLRMLVEAMLDFPEEDIDVADTRLRDSILQNVQAKLQQTLERAKQGSLLREGAHIALVGRPNVGKSSLLNRLSGEEVALVSDVPGTTRDVIRQAIQIRGIPLHIMDTAGLRVSQDEVENLGMARTHQTVQRADLILMLLDAANGCNAEEREIISGFPADIPHLLVYNKADLLSEKTTVAGEGICISAKNGDGLEALRDRMLELIGWRNQESGTFIARERHLRALHLAQEHLALASALLTQPELFAEELRLTQHALNSITGKFSADDLLGEIFSRFCIGK